ncbi:malto-oligosyltrehalose synthase [Hyphomicrobium sp.]|uniref:malto-oligosyltrehalose synthase n=1 Tax=Hyphomicrobium sp. TaxID=82 RepID=UPI000F90C960|nr:malto-oligosyltrehalose synthase [Hyphomicrobium sp.]RUO98482.1 MAG: malto-oligosyltrehalose synthase [Hyphomicrobium sp.]
MTIPIATYRLQLRNGFTFADATRIIPYLSQLGISHIYLSPIFRSTPRSTHGYDALDFNEIEPSLGGRAGFEMLVAECDRFGLKVLVDFVPNHMAAHPDNPWWRDVLEWGPRSRYAQHFDIDWSAPKLVIPVLGKSYWDVLSAGELKIAIDGARGELVAKYFDNQFPLNPEVYPAVFASSSDADLANFSGAAAASSPETSAQLKSDFKSLVASKRDAIDTVLGLLNQRRPELHSILERQVWRLAYWRTAREMLTYRRFFEISDLIGVRVELPEVFADVHRSVLDLVTAGKIDGLRIDHIDGLADPKGYLGQLRRATSAKPEMYLVVEKILGEGEDVRTDWPVDGTTGYEFIRDLSGLFVSGDLGRLSVGYRDFTSTAHDYASGTLAVKRRTLSFNLAAELRSLVAMATAVAEADLSTRDFGADAVRMALIEFAAHFTTYRTYISPGGVSTVDLDVLEAVAHRAKASREIEDSAAIDFIVSILTGRVPGSQKERAAAFVTKFQQTTGPLMAKAVEDTEFYRFNRFIALNEVGGEPDDVQGGIEAFHEAMKRRQALAPRALSATATHDTKRGEDARIRLYGISKVQDDWCCAANRWRGVLSATNVITSDEGLDDEAQWLFFQALAGAWPMTREDGASDDFVDRIEQFMIKAAREAKLRTSWTNPSSSYEERVSTFVRAALQAPNPFLDDFIKTTAPLVRAGAAASLVQTVVKVFAPGIPDIYQGTELWDLSLVDPDNRRPVDFDAREQLSNAGSDGEAHGEQDWRDGRVKLDMLRKSLAVRRSMDLTSADYEPLSIECGGQRDCFAFMRRSRENMVIVAGVIPSATMYNDSEAFGFIGAPFGDATITLPRDVERQSFAEFFSGKHLAVADCRIRIGEVLLSRPIAVLLPTS